jgi:acyl carrier protein
MDRQQTIAELIRQIAKRPDASPAPEDSLFELGFLDSFALTDFVAALEKAFGIKIPDSDLNPRKFESISRIERYLDERG